MEGPTSLHLSTDHVLDEDFEARVDWLEWRDNLMQTDVFGSNTSKNVEGIAQSLEPIFEIERSARRTIILTIDTSLSMTGEKLALTAVSLAVVALQFRESEIHIITFENEASLLFSSNGNSRSGDVLKLIENFLDVPAQGYTHLEAGLEAALKLSNRGRETNRTHTILMTDGKYTAGRDPAYMAPMFRNLNVLKMGPDKASRSLCAELATLGHGSLFEANSDSELPKFMYRVVKDLLRGKF